MAIDEKGELSEKDFIHEPKSRPPQSYWLIFGIALSIVAIGAIGISKLIPTESTSKPFLNVTNRDFSLFLWQNPDYMKPNVKEKTGYLPGFSARLTAKSANADQIVAAPPETLFLYHTWKRLVGKVYLSRPITTAEFFEFLTYDEQWLPEHWPEAPASYRELMAKMEKNSILDPQKIPTEIKQAFIGWKNFYREGEMINASTYTYADAKSLLDAHLGYSRAHWRNIHPNYLKSMETATPSTTIPVEEIPTFLRVALYNFKNERL